MRQKMSRAQIFADLMEVVYPWYTEDGRLFLDYFEGQVRRTLSVMPYGQCEFRGFFTAFCVDNYGIVPSGDFVSSAQAYFSHMVRQKGVRIKDFVRVGGTVDELYIDCANDRNDCWRISEAGVELIAGGPTHFRFLRGPGMLPLVQPDLESAPSELPKILGEFIEADSDILMLLSAWLIGAIRPEGPYPVLILTGEQGSGKSTTLRLLRRIVDPHALDMRTPPEDQRDLQAMVRNAFVLVFDNVSYISSKMSDALCVISTGTGAQGGRALYTNADEAAIRACRPIAMNGIPDVVERGDLLDRSIQIHLPRISSERRRDDHEFWEHFNRRLPRLLGALMNAAHVAVRNYGSVVLTEKPRMSAFAVWVAACEEALGWPAGKFLSVYMANRVEAENSLLEFNGTASAILRLMERVEEFSGTYSELIAECEMHLGPREQLPRSSHAFAAELRRIQPALERRGLRFYRGGRATTPGQKGRSRVIIKRDDGPSGT